MNKIKSIFYAVAHRGQLFYENEQEVKRYLQNLEGEVQATFERRRKRRSIAENNYYWGVVIKILADEFGYFKDEMHDALRMEFLKEEIENKPAKIKSTTDLTTVEMEGYLSRIRTWASLEYGIWIPEPHEVDWE